MLRWHIHLPRDLAAVCLPVLACFCLGLLIGRAEADQPQDKDIIKVFPLKNATAADVAKVLSEVYRDRVAPKGPMVLTVDEKANSLVVKAPAEQLIDIAKLLPELDVPGDRPAAKEALQDVQVRVFWFINASKDEVAPKMATQFQAVAADLKALGLDQPILFSQAMVQTMSGHRFEVQGHLGTDARGRFEVSGQLMEEDGKALLQVSIALAADPQARPASSLKTTIQITPGRMTILGTMPTETTVSAFAVLVTPKASGKKTAFSVPEGDWKIVLAWLTDVSDLPVISLTMPKGKVEIKAKFDQKPSVTEIIDMLNEVLLPQRLVIIRRAASILICDPNEPMDPHVQRFDVLDDLEKVGKYEIVKVSIALKYLNAEKIAPSIKRFSGPFGQVIPMEEVNRLILVDNGPNLRYIVQVIKEADTPSRK
jgi:hypothetical protein